MRRKEKQRESAPLAMVPATHEQTCIHAYTPPEAKGDSTQTIFAPAATSIDAVAM